MVSSRLVGEFDKGRRDFGMLQVEMLALLLVDEPVKLGESAARPIDGINLLPQLRLQTVLWSLLRVNPMKSVLLGWRVCGLLLEGLIA